MIFLQIPGNFHVATHSAEKQPKDYDFTHAIHEVSFGSKIREEGSLNL